MKYTHICTVKRSKNNEFFANICSVHRKDKPVWSTETYLRVGSIMKHLNSVPFDWKRIKFVDETGLVMPNHYPAANG